MAETSILDEESWLEPVEDLPDFPEILPIDGDGLLAALPVEEPLAGTTSQRTETLPKAARNRAYKPAVTPGALFGRLAKRKQDALAEASDEVMEDDGPRRTNAILLQGLPISKLSTEKIFEYSAYYSSTNVTQLEWIDDETCVLVYNSSAMATAAYRALRKFNDSVDEDELTPCQPLPISVRPIEDRLVQSLGGKPDATRGQINMRLALKTDVKVRNARNQSKYYERHGKPEVDGRDDSISRKRRRGDGTEAEDERPWSLRRRLDARVDDRPSRGKSLADLDAELDSFASGDGSLSLQGDDFGTDGDERRQSHSRVGRRIAGMPRRRGGGRGDNARPPRPPVDKDSLDAELDAFLKQKQE